jgi:hypothetical protein
MGYRLGECEKFTLPAGANQEKLGIRIIPDTENIVVLRTLLTVES